MPHLPPRGGAFGRMDSIVEVKEALAARSKTTSLDDLKSQGRRLVKVIRAEHIAQMLQESVQKAIAGSGLMSREEVDQLVARSQQEFKSVYREREQQLGHAERTNEENQQLRATLAGLQQERDELAKRVADLGRRGTGAGAGAGADAGEQRRLSETVARLTAERDALAARLEESKRLHAVELNGLRLSGSSPDADNVRVEAGHLRAEASHLRAEASRLRAEVDRIGAERDGVRLDLARAHSESAHLRARTDELMLELQRRHAASPPLGVAPAARDAAPNSDLMLLLMSEVAELKASMVAQALAKPGTPGAAAGNDQALSAAIDRLAGTLNERLEKFGKKIGISGAVDAPSVKLDGLFSKDHDKPLESNIDTVELKKTQGSGIGANLKRLKKLKGDG